MTRTQTLRPLKHCKKCEIDTERGSRGQCLPCQRARAKRDYDANTEQQLKRKRDRYSANNDHYREYGRQYANDWRENNPDRASENIRKGSARRRARERNAFVCDVPERDVWDANLAGVGICSYCRVALQFDARKEWDIDHIIPLARGGRHEPENLAIACVSCNRSKGAKLLSEWEPPKLARQLVA